MINFFACLPGDAFGDSDVLRKRAIAIDAEDLYVSADVSLPCTALVTVPTGDMRLCGYKIAGDDGSDFFSHFHDFTGELVTKDARGLHATLRPCVPIIDMHVCTADGGSFHLYKHITRANLRNIN